MILSQMLVAGLCATLAYGQGGWIRLSIAPNDYNCNASATGFLTVYQVHELTPATTLSRYKIENSSPTVTWLADNYLPWLHLGSSPNGVVISYGACQAAPVVIGFTLYNVTSTTCATLQVVPDPDEPTGAIVTLDCSLPEPLKYVAGGGSFTVFGVWDFGGCHCAPTPVETTTWGRIKALYDATENQDQ